MKKKLLLFSLIISGIIVAKPLSFDESLNLYLNNNLSVKNLSINETIRTENSLDIKNSTSLDLAVTAKASYALEKTGIDSKISFNDFYISAKNTDLSKTDSSLSVGYEKKLNEFLYNSDKGKITKNDLENQLSKNSDKTQKQNLIKSFAQKYLEILNIDNTIIAKKLLLEEKQKEYEIAQIKEKSNTISVYDLKVIKLNMEKLEVEISIAQKNSDYKKSEFKKLLSLNEDISLINFEVVDKFDVFVDESSLKEIETNLSVAKEQLKETKVNNLPQLTGGIAYDTKKEDLSASLSFSWYPLDYKGNETTKELSIEKLNNQLSDKKSEIELNKIKSINSFAEEELNLELNKKDIEISKSELEKYSTMKALGTVSEYDYYTKQKELLDKEITYLNAKNQLNMNKKLEIVYSKL